MGDRADLDGFEKREISCPYRDSNPRPSVQPSLVLPSQVIDVAEICTITELLTL